MDSTAIVLKALKDTKYIGREYDSAPLGATTYGEFELVIFNALIQIEAAKITAEVD